MKLFLFALATVVSLVAGNPTGCPEWSNTFDIAHAKCSHDVVFSGTSRGGRSGLERDGPYTYSVRTDDFEVFQTFRGPNLSHRVEVDFMIEHGDNTCPPFPYGPGGWDFLVFANMTENGFVYVTPCSKNPALACVDMEAFAQIQCPEPHAAV